MEALKVSNTAEGEEVGVQDEGQRHPPRVRVSGMGASRANSSSRLLTGSRLSLTLG